mgnify:FL=1
MGLKIEYEKIFDSYEQTMELMGALISNLNDMVEIEQAICYSRAIQSESVTALKNYIQDIHWTGFLNLIISCYTEINRIISSYMVGLQNLDTSIDTVIDEECLTNVETRMKQLDDELYTFTEAMKSKAESVSHIMQLPVKSGENVSTGISAMAKEAVRVREDFIEYEERKKREVDLYDDLMSDMIRVGLGYLNARPNILNYHRDINALAGIFQISDRYQKYYVDVGYSQEQAKQEVDQMQDLLIVYNNKKKSDQDMKYVLNVIVAAASLIIPMGVGCGIAYLAAAKITYGFALYYNLDQAKEAYDAGYLADTWNTDREAKGLTDFEKGSCSETIYNCVGNISTKVTVSRFKSEAKGKLKDIIGFDELFPREENELTQIKDGYDKINGEINKLKDAQAVMPNYSDMIKDATTYEKIKELEENGRQW